MTKTLAIATPTGNVGSKLVEQLIASAERLDLSLVLLVRKPLAVAHLAQPRVKIADGRLEDPDFLVRATAGVHAMYWATPNSFPPEWSLREGYRRFAASAAAAIRHNRIAHTVHLSGFAHVDDGGAERSLFGALQDTETLLGGAVDELLRELPQRRHGITHLRAGFMFENLLGQLNYLREHGALFVPVNRARRIPMVASADVAARAFELLVGEGPSGRAFTGAFGPHDLSFGEAAAHLSQGLGRKVRVVRLPRCVVRSRMLRLGRDRRPTDAFMLAFGAISDGKVTAQPGRDRRSTTPTTMAAWANEVVRPLLDSEASAACPTRVQYEAS